MVRNMLLQPSEYSYPGDELMFSLNADHYMGNQIITKSLLNEREIRSRGFS